MKNILLYSLLACTALTSIKASAAVTMISANPADNSTLQYLSKISTEWNGDGNWLEPDDTAMAIVKDADGETVANGYFEIDWDEIDVFNIILNRTVTEPGAYTVEIPDNVFWDTTNTPAVLHYIVEGKSGEDVTFLRSTPVAGSELTSISVIETYWDAAMDITYDTSVRAKLVDSYGDTVATGKLKQDWNTNGHFTITFDPAFTTPGEYEVVLPANCFFDLDYYESVTSAELRLPYTIISSAAPTALDFERAYPSNKSEVSALTEIKLYWLTGDHTFTLREDASAAIEDTEGNRTICSIVAGDENNQFIILVEPEISIKGEYTVIVPADIFLNADGEDVESEEVILYYIVKPNEIKVPYEAYFISSNPEAYDKVASLSTIITEWDCQASNPTIAADITVVVTDEDEETVTTGYMSMDSDDETALTILITLEKEINVNGNYAVTIPEDFLIDAEGDTIVSERVIIPVIVDITTGIDQVTSDDEEIFYTLDGQMLKNASGVKGIYIVKTKTGVTKRIIK